MTKTFQITLPLVIGQVFEDDEYVDMEDVKEQLGELLDSLLLSTDYLYDYWKDAVVEEV